MKKGEKDVDSLETCRHSNKTTQRDNVEELNDSREDKMRIQQTRPVGWLTNAFIFRLCFWRYVA